MENEKKCKYCKLIGVWWDEEHTCSNKPAPISEVLGDINHPGHDEIKQLLADLQSGKINLS